VGRNWLFEQVSSSFYYVYCMGCRLWNNSGQQHFLLFFLGQHWQK
jgi:hypothetical protein